MGMGCSWSAKAETTEELVMKAKEHAMKEHPDMWESKMKNMTDKEIEEMMKPAIKEE